MPSFDGVNIFGGQVRMRRKRAERAGQRNEYGGLDGKEFLDMGGRGLFTEVEGRHTGATAAALNAAQLLFESYSDGASYVLVDQFGNVWPDVMMVEFAPVGPLSTKTPSGVTTQAYQARFEHLSG